MRAAGIAVVALALASTATVTSAEPGGALSAAFGVERSHPYRPGERGGSPTVTLAGPAVLAAAVHDPQRGLPRAPGRRHRRPAPFPHAGSTPLIGPPTLLGLRHSLLVGNDMISRSETLDIRRKDDDMSNDNGGSNPLRTSKGGGPHHTTSVPFLQLRYAYMRAIARAWGEPDYLDLLVKLSLSDENRDNGGVLDQFRDDYNLEFPWNKVDFCIAIDEAGKHPSTRRQPVWLPRGGWYGTDDEFEITVPKTPIPEQVTTCLTRYSEMFPSILGSAIKHDGRRTARQPVPPADFAVMGIVMKNFLALIWDPKTEGKLADHFFRQGPAEQLRIFQNLTGYMFPWRFTLKVNQCAAETPSDNKDETWDEYWKSFPNTRITVYIPHKPDASFADPWEETPDAEDPPTDHGLEAVALAAYNATGDQYPFSCG